MGILKKRSELLLPLRKHSRKWGMDWQSNQIFLNSEKEQYFYNSKACYEEEFESLLDMLSSARKMKLSLCLPEEPLLIKKLPNLQLESSMAISKAVTVQAEQILPWALDDCFYDYYSFETGDKTKPVKEIWLYAMHKGPFSEFFKALASRGIQVDKIHLRPSIIAAGSLWERPAGAVIEVKENKVRCSILKKGMPIAIKDFPFFYKANQDNYQDLMGILSFYLHYFEESILLADSKSPDLGCGIIVALNNFQNQAKEAASFLCENRRNWLPNRLTLLYQGDPYFVSKSLSGKVVLP